MTTGAVRINLRPPSSFQEVNLFNTLSPHLLQRRPSLSGIIVSLGPLAGLRDGAAASTPVRCASSYGHVVV